MKINQIRLYNFGSYEGSSRFDFSSCSEKNRIVIFGGKNGAGKTTLFTAIQVGLYGHYAFGFRTPGKLYKRRIMTFINNNAKLDENKTASVEISFSERRGNDLLHFTVIRSWSWVKKELEEMLAVTSDGIPLGEAEIVDFQNYLIHLIPPELLSLYFFDGENAVDTFFGENKGNIHDALMTLSGNDTFEILYAALRKLLKNKPNDGAAAEAYALQRDQVNAALKKLAELQNRLEENECEQDAANADLEHLLSSYEKKGGISIERWKQLQQLLRDEEQKREELNHLRRQAAETVLPFLIIQPLLEQVKDQIAKEKEFYDYEALKKAIQSDGFLSELVKAASDLGSRKPKSDGALLYRRVADFLLRENWEGFTPILSLSDEDAAICRTQIAKVENADSTQFSKLKARLDESIARSKEIRVLIDTSTIDSLESYLTEKYRLQEAIERLGADRHQLLVDLSVATEREQKEKGLLEARRKEFVQAVKSKSVESLAGKVMLIVESLQAVLYQRLIKNVEADLNQKLKELMRKDDFWQEVRIDGMFNVHIVCQQPADISALISTISNSGLDGLKAKIGEEAFDVLLKSFHTSEQMLPQRLKDTVRQSIVLPMELGFDQLSKGEKQIFVMSLYWAIMNQSDNEIPFIIDTPFARIDADHRENITKYFFTQLKGQLFVMSTDEELSQHHLSSMKNQIAELYMLEYDESLKRTTVRRDRYFEV